MPKGYWIGILDVRDQDSYLAYRAKNGLAFAKYGGRFLVRGGAFEAPIGTTRSRHVVIEFPTIEAARACFSSPEYQDALAEQKGGVALDLVIVEGYEGPQPGDG